MGSGPADEKLMLRYAGGDTGAFEALYRRHRGPLYRFLLRQTGNVATAEELFQDVWMRVIDFRGRYEARARFSSWLYAVAHNRLMDFYRAGGKAHFLARQESEEVLEKLAADDPRRRSASIASAPPSACSARSPNCPKRSASPFSCSRRAISRSRRSARRLASAARPRRAGCATPWRSCAPT